MKTSITQRTIAAYNKNAAKYADKFDSYDIYQKKISDPRQSQPKFSKSLLDIPVMIKFIRLKEGNGN